MAPAPRLPCRDAVRGGFRGCARATTPVREHASRTRIVNGAGPAVMWAEPLAVVGAGSRGRGKDAFLSVV